MTSGLARRLSVSLATAALLFSAACGGNAAVPMATPVPPAPTPTSATVIAGTWTGTLTELIGDRRTVDMRLTVEQAPGSGALTGTLDLGNGFEMYDVTGTARGAQVHLDATGERILWGTIESGRFEGWFSLGCNECNAVATFSLTFGEASGGDLAIRQILLRYDGQREQGSLEVTVCNLGTATAGATALQLRVNGVAFDLSVPARLAAGNCADVYDPASEFSSFGIAEAGSYDLGATVTPAAPDDPPANNTLAQVTAISQLGPLGPTSDLAGFSACYQPGVSGLEDCFGSVLFDALPDPHEVKKQMGDWVVITPAEFEPLAAWTLADNALCARNLSEYLGVPMPAPVAQRHIVSDRLTIFAAGHNDRVIAVGPAETHRQQLDRLPTLWAETNQGVCHNPHELTHLVVNDTPFPGWLNEGIATYMEDPGRTGAVDPGRQIVCEPGGWVEIDSTGRRPIVPYRNLSGYDPTVRMEYYITGSCFWDYIEQTYGHQTFQLIVQTLVARRDPIFNSCTPELRESAFLRDIVNPIIGADISEITQPRFGVGLTWTGCEGA